LINKIHNDINYYIIVNDTYLINYGNKMTLMKKKLEDKNSYIKDHKKYYSTK